MFPGNTAGLIPGPELSDEAVTVGVTTVGTTGATPVVAGVTVEAAFTGLPAGPVVVGVNVEPALAGVVASPVVVGVLVDPTLVGVVPTPEVVGVTPAGTPPDGVTPRPGVVGVVFSPEAAGDGAVLPAATTFGADPETTVGFAGTPVATAEPVAATTPWPPSPPLLTTTGVGAELIEELTVFWGFAVSAGGTYWPVGLDAPFEPEGFEPAPTDRVALTGPSTFPPPVS